MNISARLCVRNLVPVLVLVATSVGAQALQQAEREAFEARPVDAAITAADIEACVRFMACDAMRGRATGSPELMQVAGGLATRLAAAGVGPGGDEGSYLHAVPIVHLNYTAVPELSLILADGTRREAVWGVDFDFVSGILAAGSFELASLGEDRPAAVEPAATHALFVDARGGMRSDLARGAGEGWALLITRGSASPGRKVSTEAPRGRRDRGGPVNLVARGELLELLTAGSVKSIQAAIPGERVESPAANVIGLIRGVGTPERPELAEQCVVYSAHYDHIGVKENAAEGEDAIFNGADDDASGCAALLEIAEAFAAGPPPARTLVFLFATGEEIGLVGTYHYIEHPVIPIEATVCNLNFEMIGRPDALVGGAGKLWLTGYERSNLGPEFLAAGAEVLADPRLDQKFFQRSDNYAFALLGIVAQTLSSYDLHKDYHHVTDSVETLDWAHMLTAVRTSWTAAQALASGAIDPVWLPGGMPSR